MRLLRRLCLVGLLLLLSVPAFAQRFTATIRGTVTDPTRAPIPGAKVTVKAVPIGVATVEVVPKDSMRMLASATPSCCSRARVAVSISAGPHT